MPRVSALPALASVLVVITCTSLLTLVAAASAQGQGSYDSALVELVNQWRASQGRNRLAYAPGLETIADRWSDHMATGSASCEGPGDRYEHSDLQFGDPRHPHGTTMLGENLSWSCGQPGILIDISLSGATWTLEHGPLPPYCQPEMDFTSPELVMCSWLTSPLHRANIDNPDFTHMSGATHQRSIEHPLSSVPVVELFTTHLFSKSTLPDFDPTCNGALDIVDALVIAQFDVSLRTAVRSCALTDPTSQINTDRADIDGNGTVDIVDALRAARCAVALDMCS